LGVEHASYEIEKVWRQVVAGTNNYFHLKSDNGKEYSVIIFVPLPHTQAPPEISFAEAGFSEASHKQN
jgi:hypothetical protein